MPSSERYNLSISARIIGGEVLYRPIGRVVSVAIQVELDDVSSFWKISDGECREEVPLIPDWGVVIFFHERCFHREFLAERLAGSDVETHLIFGLNGVAIRRLIVVLLRALVS